MWNEWKVALAFLLTVTIALAIPVYGWLEPGLRRDRAEELDARRLNRGAQLYAKYLAPQYGDYGEGGPNGPLRGTEKLSSQAQARKFVAATAEGLAGAQKEDLTYFLLNWNSEELRRAEGVLPEMLVEVWGSQVDPGEIALEVGRKVRLRLANFGAAPHSLRIKGIRVKPDGGSAREGLRLDVEPGKEATLVLIPQEPGEFLLTCESSEHSSGAVGGIVSVTREGARR